MSKSLGNFFTVREILRRYQPEEVRYFILSSHYRSPLNYSDDNLDKARGALQRLYTALRDCAVEGDAIQADYDGRFQAAMNDDFNTAEAAATLFELASEVNRTHDEPLAAQLRALGAVLGLLERSTTEFLQAAPGTEAPDAAAIEAAIAERTQAKKRRDFATADQLREQLLDKGIVLEDTPDGTLWRRA